MLSFKSVEELRQAPDSVREDVIMLVGDEDGGDFEYLFGGKVYLVQNFKDLALCEGFNWEFATKENRNPSLLDSVESFEDIREVGGYTCYYITTNNSGGNIYYVPNFLTRYVEARKYANLDKPFQLQIRTWDEEQKNEWIALGLSVKAEVSDEGETYWRCIDERE
jgi:hypothetical protein